MLPGGIRRELCRGNGSGGDSPPWLDSAILFGDVCKEDDILARLVRIML